MLAVDLKSIHSSCSKVLLFQDRTKILRIFGSDRGGFGTNSLSKIRKNAIRDFRRPKKCQHI